MFIRKLIYFVLILNIIFFSAKEAFPQDEGASDKIKDFGYSLSEVVVTGKRDGVESIGTVHEVTSEDIEKSSTRTVDEAIELVPSLNVRIPNEGVPRIDIRGFRTRQILLLLDGIPVNSTFDQQFDPSTLTVDNIEKIKITAGGGGSMLYGQGGVAGIINIISKKGEEDFHSTATSEFGEGRMYLVRGNVSGSVDKFNYFLSGSSYSRNGFPLSDDFKSTRVENGGLRNNSDKVNNNIFTSFGYSPRKDITLKLNLSYVEGHYGIPGSVIDDLLHDEFAQPPRIERVDRFEGFTGQVAVDYDMPGPLDFRAWVYFNKMNEDRSRSLQNPLFPIPVKGTLMGTNEMRSKGINLQTRCDLKKAGSVTLALSYERDTADVNTNKDELGIPVIAGGGSGGLSGDTKGVLNVYYTALEYELPVSKDLGVVLGYNYQWLTTGNISADSASYFFTKQNSGSRSDNDYGMMIGAYYDVFEKTRLRFSFSRKVRFPSIRQFFDPSSGNPALKSERAYQYELGIEEKLPYNSYLHLTGYFTDALGFIEKNESTGLFENFEKDRFKGIEVEAGTKFLKNLTLRGSYSYMKAENAAADALTDKLQYRPKDKISIEGNYDFDFGLSSYFSLLYVANQHYFSKPDVSGVLLTRKLSDYTVVNVKVRQKILNDKVSFYIGIDNLFDKNYQQSYGIPQAGRFIYTGIQVQI